MIKILISACLLGRPVRYDGSDYPCDRALLKTWEREGRLIPVCPEMAGGLPVPRPPAEIVGGDADGVLAGRAQVRDREGGLVTAAFLRGAQLALEAARAGNAQLAILAERSPSCGVSRVYDGRFSGGLIPGRGVTAALLAQNGLALFSQDQIEDVARWLEERSHE